MKVIIVSGVIIMIFFSWALCAVTDYDIGIDEDEEQAEWLRKYEEKKQREMNGKKSY